MKRVRRRKNTLKIFLCHASEDKAIVRDLYRRLKDEGFEPWLDSESILPGQEWAVEIHKAVRSSDIIIVCLSTRSSRKSGFVQKEIRSALDIADEQPEGAIFLIPVKIKECSIPDRLSKWQCVNLFEENGYARLVTALRARAKELRIENVKSTVHKAPEAKTNSNAIMADDIRKARVALENSFIRWQKTGIIPPVETLQMVTAYSTEIYDSFTELKNAFMLRVALWYGQHISYWTDRNKKNKAIIPILVHTLQSPEERPFYRIGIVLEGLEASLSKSAISNIRRQITDNEQVEEVLRHAEQKTTLSFWENELSKRIHPDKAKELLRQFRADLVSRKNRSK